MADEPSPGSIQEYYRLINAGGNHYDIGRKMTDAFTEQLHARLSSPVAAELLENALRTADTLFSTHPVLKDELQGIAEGISIEFESMLAEVTDYRALATHSMTVVSKSGDGLVIGRSFSASPSTYVRNLLRLDPNDSYASLGRMAGYFAGTWESIGVYGQFVSADITSQNDAPRQGVASYMVPRIITESSKSLETAVEKMGTIVQMHDSSYIVAGADKAYLFVAENGAASPEEITTFPFVLVNGRKEKTSQEIAGIDGVKAFLSDHGTGGCVHAKDVETLYAMVVDMGAEQIEYTDGPPCKSGFNKVDWPGGYG